MKTSHLFLISISISLLMHTSLKAEEMEKILDQPSRPTMEQLIPLFEKMKENPFKDNGGGRHVSELYQGDSLQKSIAAMEKAFPGATFFELGRDAVHLGDAMDAFYLSLGDKGRVKRLDASHPSFKVEDQTLVYDFLKSNGIDISKIMELPPQVVFDITSFNKTNGVGGGASQSVRVMRPLYEEYAKLGKNPKELIKRVNFISIGGMYGTKIEDLADPNFDFEKSFATQSNSVKLQEFDLPLYTDLITFGYTASWHDIFKEFKKRPDGTVSADLPTPSSASTRKGIISDMYETWKAVNDPNFKEIVEAHANIRGFNFPNRRTEKHLLISPDKAKQAFAKLEEIELQKIAKRKKLEKEERQKKFATKMEKNGISKEGADYIRRFETAFSNRTKFFDASEPILNDLPVNTRLTKEDYIGIIKLLYEEANDNELEKLNRKMTEVVAKNEKIKEIMNPEVIDSNLNGFGSYEIKKRITRFEKGIEIKLDVPSLEKKKSKKSKSKKKSCLERLSDLVSIRKSN